MRIPEYNSGDALGARDTDTRKVEARLAQRQECYKQLHYMYICFAR